MSRIEEALEKALKMRESAVESIEHEKVFIDRDTGIKAFEVHEKVIDTAKVEKHIICITNPSSAIAEQYRKLRAKLLKYNKERFCNTIMVTSPEIGEGKSVTSINLAVSLANEFDYTVLLVDADLKNPSVSKYLGITSQNGLYDYLLGYATLPDILVKTGIGRLVVITAGNTVAHSDTNTAELLSSSRMEKLVHELKNRYKDRYVIFDSAPVLSLSDSISLSGYMDGVILVLQATRTTPKTAMHAMSQIQGTNILGVVFNAVPDYLAKHMYSYYYHLDSRVYSDNSTKIAAADKESL